MRNKINSKKGFTLIELLIVIAILAILATAVITVLNPAQLLKQARDSTRISDLAALNSAISLYLADVSSPSLGTCAGGTARCTASSTSGLTTRTACSVSTSTSVTNTGWVDVNFASISAGSPLPKEPMDPVNSTSYFYSYGCSSTTYEIDARMESTKYGSSGGSDVVSTDGGDNATVYEVGNSLVL